MNKSLKLFTTSLTLLFSGQLFADLIDNNLPLRPGKTDIRKTDTTLFDLSIFVTDTPLSSPSADSFSLELNCSASSLWDIFEWQSKPVYSKVFNCPHNPEKALGAQRLSNVCYKFLKVSGLPDELAGNVSCVARVKMKGVVYEYSAEAYAKRWNFPLSYPYIGETDVIFLPLNEATISVSNEP